MRRRNYPDQGRVGQAEEETGAARQGRSPALQVRTFKDVDPLDPLHPMDGDPSGNKI